MFEKRGGLIDGLQKDVCYAPIFPMDLEGLEVVAQTLAHFAGDEKIGHQLKINAKLSYPIARIAPPPRLFRLKREAVYPLALARRVSAKSWRKGVIIPT